jgi:hypothetical protein
VFELTGTLQAGESVNCRHTDADTSAVQRMGKSASAMLDAGFFIL